MGKTVNIRTKVALSKLVAEVEQGGEVVIARGGKPVAKLVSLKKKKPGNNLKVDRAPGFMKGKIWMSPDFDDPLPADMLAAMLGEDD